MSFSCERVQKLNNKYYFEKNNRRINAGAIYESELLSSFSLNRLIGFNKSYTYVYITLNVKYIKYVYKIPYIYTLRKKTHHQSEKESFTLSICRTAQISL